MTLQYERFDSPFFMPVEDLTTIVGRGFAVIGKIESGTLRTGDRVEILGFDKKLSARVHGIQYYRKDIIEAQVGESPSILLSPASSEDILRKEDIERGMVLAKPGSVTQHRKFKAAIDILTREEGGRTTLLTRGYKPEFLFRTADIKGTILELYGPDGLSPCDMAMPGDNVFATIELLSSVVMNPNLRFAMREGGRTIVSGVICEVIE